MHRPNLLLLVLVITTVVLKTASVAAQEPPKVKKLLWRAVYQKPGFATVDAFVEKLRLRQEPWAELLMPDDLPDYENVKDFTNPKRLEVAVIHRSKESAMVFARNKPHRQAPFSAVIFLLTTTGRRFHVTDLIRKSEGYESYSDVSEPKILKLQPSRFVHFYFTEYLGGRKWDFDSDEFYLVKGSKFRRTLVLKNDAAFLSPADPYGEFSQTAEISVTQGRPRVKITRDWSMDGRESVKQELSVVFQWNPRLEKFTSSSAGRIALKEPPSWSGDGLPKPRKKSQEP